MRESPKPGEKGFAISVGAGEIAEMSEGSGVAGEAALRGGIMGMAPGLRVLCFCSTPALVTSLVCVCVLVFSPACCVADVRS